MVPRTHTQRIAALEHELEQLLASNPLIELDDVHLPTLLQELREQQASTHQRLTELEERLGASEYDVFELFVLEATLRGRHASGWEWVPSTVQWVEAEVQEQNGD